MRWLQWRPALLLLLLLLLSSPPIVHVYALSSQPNTPRQLSTQTQTQTQTQQSSKNIILYTTYWDNLLLEEYKEQVDDLRQRRKTWSRDRLISSGLSIFNAAAEPDSELFGDKIIRIYVYGEKRLRDKFTRGDVLLLTPNEQHEEMPRECLVVDVGNDWLTAGVGPSWLRGLYEARKLPGSYRVRLDRTVPRAPLKAQRQALSLLSKNKAGDAANLLAHLFLQKDDTKRIKRKTAELPRRLLSMGNHAERNDIILAAMNEALEKTTFLPNKSQASAIRWALQRRISLMRGPPGTGKTRVAAALIATYLKIPDQFTVTSEDNALKYGRNSNNRVLAVTHSNGAADVLLEALLQLGVPAVRLGRPASVSPTVQHRTVIAIAEKLPEVARLRQIVQNPSMHQQRRSAAVFDMKQYMMEAQDMILQSAPVIVTSCIGAHQLVSEDEQRKIKFSMLVCDESAQTTEPSLMCALSAAQAEQVVFVGDTQQLPPTVTTSSPELRDSLGLSPMARLERLGVGQTTLRIQYRMPTALLEHPSRYFYKNLVRCAENVDELEPPAGFAWPRGLPLAFVQTGGPDSEIAHSFGGRSNPTEAALVAKIAKDLLAAGDVSASDISVITPYSKQVQLIRAELSMIRNAQDIRAGTVDSFQGQETGVVLFSAVRSNPLSELGFLRDRRRLCVAITRARRGLIIFGDAKVLKTCRHWEALIDSCEERGCLMSIADLREETKTTTDTNSEVVAANETQSVEDALDDLLGGSNDLYGLFV